MISKKIVELDADMRPAVTNVVFISEDNEAQDVISPQDNLDDEGDDWGSVWMSGMKAFSSTARGRPAETKQPMHWV